MKTTDQKSQEYSSILCNQSGIYTKGEIETAFVFGYNEALSEIGLPCQSIIEERLRQIEVEGWTTDHDDRHIEGEFAQAAACYAMPELVRKSYQSYSKFGWFPRWWPKSWSVGWWKPSKDGSIESRKKELIKAGALILAELERLNRLQERF